MESKHAFEEYAAKFGVKIQKYHAENGALNTLVIKESIISANQTIDFSGVDANNQNIISERMIKTLKYLSQGIILKTIIC